MTADVVYRIRVRLLCVDRGSRAFAQLAPGSAVTYVCRDDQQMIVLRWAGREILAFAADLQDRADAVGGPAQ